MSLLEIKARPQDLDGLLKPALVALAQSLFLEATGTVVALRARILAHRAVVAAVPAVAALPAVPAVAAVAGAATDMVAARLQELKALFAGGSLPEGIYLELVRGAMGLPVAALVAAVAAPTSTTTVEDPTVKAQREFRALTAGIIGPIDAPKISAALYTHMFGGLCPDEILRQDLAKFAGDSAARRKIATLFQIAGADATPGVLLGPGEDKILLRLLVRDVTRRWAACFAAYEILRHSPSLAQSLSSRTAIRDEFSLALDNEDQAAMGATLSAALERLGGGTLKKHLSSILTDSANTKRGRSPEPGTIMPRLRAAWALREGLYGESEDYASR